MSETDMVVQTIRWGLDQANKNYNSVIEMMAETAMVQYVRPFCDRNKVKFLTGMGAFTFAPADRSVEDSSTIAIQDKWDNVLEHGPQDGDDEPVPEGYAELLEILKLETLSGKLFERMVDYDPSGIPEPSPD